jgi:ribosomal protein L27
VFQSIIDTSQTTMSTDVEFDDFNFDGFLDFVLISDIDGAGNTSRHFWIYDDVQKRFVFNEKLSDQLVGEMVYNFSAKTIETGCSVGMGGDSNIFKFINGELTLVESNREEQVVVNDSTKIKRTIEKLVDGQLKVVEETYEDR